MKLNWKSFNFDNLFGKKPFAEEMKNIPLIINNKPPIIETDARPEWVNRVYQTIINDLKAVDYYNWEETDEDYETRITSFNGFPIQQVPLKTYSPANRNYSLLANFEECYSIYFPILINGGLDIPFTKEEWNEIYTLLKDIIKLKKEKQKVIWESKSKKKLEKQVQSLFPNCFK